MLSFFLILVSWLIFLLISVVRYTTFHLLVDLQVSSFSQILYNLNEGLNGSSDVWNEAIRGFFEYCGPSLAIMTFACAALGTWCLVDWYKKRKNPDYKEDNESKTLSQRLVNSRKMIVACVIWLVVSCLTLGLTAVSSLDQLGYFRYRRQMEVDSHFYDQYYAHPDSTEIIWPSKPKNLIYIFMESMESSFADKANGGAYDINYIPELTELAKEGVTFAADDTIGGAKTTVNSTWTVAGMVSQTSGTPLTALPSSSSSDSKNGNWLEERPFLPGVTSIGELLQDQGYHNALLLGSAAAYAGRNSYFSQHGSYDQYDYVWANATGHTPYPGYNVWWGYEDSILFDNAKWLASALAEGEQPFNLTMLTADTHFPDGYECDLCPDLYDDQMKNVIACSDHQVSEFVRWIFEQPWGQDTVVVLAGDHYSMDKKLGSELADFNRKIYFTILNGKDYEGAPRDFTSLDIFPTTLAAMGCRIRHNRLGLGTNLYSDRPTLLEELGMDVLDEEIPGLSSYYSERLLEIDPANGDEMQSLSLDNH